MVQFSKILQCLENDFFRNFLGKNIFKIITSVPGLKSFQPSSQSRKKFGHLFGTTLGR
jgi:hypothetical protein